MPVRAVVVRDPADPDAKGPLAIIAVDGCERRDKSFLGQIHRLLGIADLPDDQSVNQGFVAIEQLTIGVLASRPRKRRQIRIGPLRQARTHRSEEHTSELQSLMRIPY